MRHVWQAPRGRGGRLTLQAAPSRGPPMANGGGMRAMSGVQAASSQGIATLAHDDRGTTTSLGARPVTRTPTAAPEPETRAATGATPRPRYEGRVLPDPTEPAWDQGLAFDVETLVGRRRVLQAGIGLGTLGVGLAACGTAGSTPGATRPPRRRASAATDAASAAACA